MKKMNLYFVLTSKQNMATNMERYGLQNLTEDPEIRRHVQQTNMHRYGVEYPIQNPEIRRGSKDTMLKRYGPSFESEDDDSL